MCIVKDGYANFKMGTFSTFKQFALYKCLDDTVQCKLYLVYIFAIILSTKTLLRLWIATFTQNKKLIML